MAYAHEKNVPENPVSTISYASEINSIVKFTKKNFLQIEKDTKQECQMSMDFISKENENHFRQVYFWGRIFGADKDYYIAHGYIKDALLGRLFYYSTNCIDWGLLPSPTENGKLLTPLCTTKFQGDPALMIEILVDKDDKTVPGIRTGPKIMRLKEEDRLATTIYLINEEAVAIPRGALFRRPDGVTVENLSFEGLKAIDAIEASYFLHYRTPRQKWNTNLLTRSDYNYAMDFLDPLDIDIPEGCWLIHLVGGDTLVILKPLYWPGMINFHFLETNKFGYVYFGHGKKSLDVPFLLQPL